MPVRKTTNKTKTKSYIKYHNDGSIWAKGKMADALLPGIGNSFAKMEPLCVPGILKMVNKQESGRPMIKKERVIK